MAQFHWRIPVHGDKGDISKTYYTRGTWAPPVDGNLTPTPANGQPDGTPYHDYLLEVAKSAEISGFDGALIPSFPDSEDPWVISTAIARHTKSLRFMIAYQPNWFDPLQAAKVSASLQRLSGGRLLFNIITGMQQPTSGRVRLDGVDVTRAKRHIRARLGIARTFQRLEPFGSLTARENVLVALEMRRRWATERYDAMALADGFRSAVLIAAVACALGGLLAALTIRNPERAAPSPEAAEFHCALDAPPLRGSHHGVAAAATDG